jgi:hypothetical protein
MKQFLTRIWIKLSNQKEIWRKNAADFRARVKKTRFSIEILHEISIKPEKIKKMRKFHEKFFKIPKVGTIIACILGQNAKQRTSLDKHKKIPGAAATRQKPTQERNEYYGTDDW